MTADTALVRRLGLLLVRQMTSAGHLAQIVSNEHRGICDVRGCAPACLEARQAVLDLSEWLEANPEPAQLALLPEAAGEGRRASA